MKKLTIPFAFFLVASNMISCTKESSLISTPPPPSSTVQTVPNNAKMISSWFSPVFNLTNDRNSIFLMAQKDHETRIDFTDATHVKLAFARLNYQGSPVYKRLSVTLSASQSTAGTANKICEINFGLNTTGCIVTIKNADRNSSAILLSNPFADLQIRYIVIPRSLYESLNINWDDYAVVAPALGI